MKDLSRGSGDPRRPAAAIAAATAVLVCAALCSAFSLAESETWPRAVTDAVGRKVVIRAEPARLVSMAPNVTEILLALGLRDRLIGVSDFCRVPPDGPQPARIGGLLNPDLEKIVSLKPDLAIATTAGNYVDDADRITRLGVPVYTCDAPDVEAVLETIRSLGSITGKTSAAADLVSRMRSRLDAARARSAGAPAVRVLFLVWGDPMLAPGRGAFINDVLARAGAVSVSSEATSRWAEFDLEQVIKARPEVILTVPDNKAFAESLQGRAEWRSVPAVKNHRVVIVSDAVLQPGPRVVDAIEEIESVIHPR